MTKPTGLPRKPRKPSVHDWPAERTERLKQLHALGYSASQISTALGRVVSRNAVIGKIHRLGLTPHLRQVQTAKVRRAVSQRSGHAGGVATNLKHRRGRLFASYAPLRPEPALPPTCEPVTLMERTNHQCCWPIGKTNGPDTLMCGAPKSLEASYCQYHAERGMTKAREPWTPVRRAKFMRAMGAHA